MPYEVDPTDGGNVSESTQRLVSRKCTNAFLGRARHADATRLIYRPVLVPMSLTASLAATRSLSIYVKEWSLCSKA